MNTRPLDDEAPREATKTIYVRCDERIHRAVQKAAARKDESVNLWAQRVLALAATAENGNPLILIPDRRKTVQEAEFIG